MHEQVRVRDARGNWYDATAVSGVEGTHKNGKRVHDFPVVWIDFGDGDPPMAWPADYVEARDG